MSELKRFVKYVQPLTLHPPPPPHHHQPDTRSRYFILSMLPTSSHLPLTHPLPSLTPPLTHPLPPPLTHPLPHSPPPLTHSSSYSPLPSPPTLTRLCLFCHCLCRGIVRRNSMWDYIIFHKIQKSLGGRVRFILTGSAPISDKVLKFLRCAFGCMVSQVLCGYIKPEAHLIEILP